MLLNFHVFGTLKKKGEDNKIKNKKLTALAR